MISTQRRSRLGISLFVICFFILWSLRATVLYTIDDSILSETTRIAYSTLIKLLLWVLPAFSFAYWVRHSSPCRYLGLSQFPSLHQWLWSILVILLFLGAVVCFELVTGKKELSLAYLPLSITLPGVLFSLVSPLLEEILFRGLFLKEFLGLMPHWSANLLTSLLFAGIHLPYWLSHAGFNATVIANTISVFFFSLVAGWLYQKSSSIWPPALAHIANNFLSALLVSSL
jgi:membrane protease YdiL (CAAX protease family)